MKYKNLQKNKAFVILFAVTLAAILLSISLGVSNITLSEIKFDTNARDTNDAFFAADTGAECAFYFNRSDQNKFPKDGPSQDIICVNNSTISPSYPAEGITGVYRFTVTGLGNTGLGCAIVTVDKTNSPAVTIISDGYNNGGDNNCTSTLNTVEREIKATY